MAEPKENALMEKIVSLCKRRGFIYQSSEIYGGINGFWDYGPLGAELKRNVKDLWWRDMVLQRDDVVGLEATIIMSPAIWKASGHVDTFADLMRECPMTNKRFRADQVESQSGWVFSYCGARSKTVEEIINTAPDMKDALDRVGREISDQEAKEIDIAELEKNYGREVADLCRKLTQRDFIYDVPFAVLVAKDWHKEAADKVAAKFYEKLNCKGAVPRSAEPPKEVINSSDFNTEKGEGFGAQLTSPRPFNLMFKTYVGPIESEDNVAYLRPETAQAIFAQFKNVLETSRQKVPFGIGQIGKAFRNEVTPRNYTFRSREFEQMELEFFIKPDEVVEAIQSFKIQDSSVQSDPPLETENLKLETSADWGWEAWHKYWVEQRMAFYEGIGLPRTTLVEYWQKPEELAHYARATVDILFKFPFSKRDEKGELMGEELEGIAARSDFDLSQHERFSGKPMGVFDDELRAAWGKLDEAKKTELSKRYYEARLKYLTKTGVEQTKAEKEAKEDADGLAKGQYIPHVIEPSAGVDRLILALICNAYSEVTDTDEKGKAETRVIMKFHPRVAPVKVGVMPLLKNKPELVKKAKEVRDLLRPHMNVFYDEAGSIGRRYARQDEAGTPFCVTIDFDTLGEKPELKDTVTIRYRDDGRQERVNISELLPLLQEKIR